MNKSAPGSRYFNLNIFLIISTFFLFPKSIFSNPTEIITIEVDPEIVIEQSEIKTLIVQSTGLFISEEFRKKDYYLNEWNFALGTASTTLFDRVLKNVFSDISIVSTKDGHKAMALIEPTIEDFQFIIPTSLYGIYRAHITYKIRIYDNRGKVYLSFSQSGTGKRSSRLTKRPDTSQNLADTAVLAMSDAMTKIVKELFRFFSTNPFYAEQAIDFYEKARITYFDTSDYQTASKLIIKAISLFEKTEKNPFRDRFLAYSYIMLGACFVFQNAQTKAHENFIKAMVLTPGITPDPLMYSGKILYIFQQVHIETMKER